MLPNTSGTRVRLFRAYVAAALLVCSLGVGAEPTVSLKVSARVSTAPVKLRFTVRVEPNPNNRMACLSYDSADGEVSSSCWQVDGDTHPRTSWIDRHIGRAGEYTAVVTVVSVVEGKTVHTTARTQFIVTEPGVPYVR